MALFGRNASKMEGSTRKNGSYEAVVGRKEADLAPPSLTLLFTKQALRDVNVIQVAAMRSRLAGLQQA